MIEESIVDRWIDYLNDNHALTNFNNDGDGDFDQVVCSVEEMQSIFNTFIMSEMINGKLKIILDEK